MSHTRMQTISAVGSATALALALSGCGSSGSSTLSVAQFKSQADAICKTLHTKTDALNPGASATTAQLDTAVRKVADLVNAEVAQLKALKAPASISADVTAMLDSVSAAAKTLKDQGSAVLSAKTSPFDDANKKAAALGLKECGK